MFWNCRYGYGKHERWTCQTLKKDSSTKGINVVIDENNEILIDFHIIVAYGVNIATIADNIISSVKYKIEEFTGMTVKKVNIYVEGVRTID